jgi:hypothetical protein
VWFTIFGLLCWAWIPDQILKQSSIISQIIAPTPSPTPGLAAAKGKLKSKVDILTCGCDLELTGHVQT